MNRRSFLGLLAGALALPEKILAAPIPQNVEKFWMSFMMWDSATIVPGSGEQLIELFVPPTPPHFELSSLSFYFPPQAELRDLQALARGLAFSMRCDDRVYLEGPVSIFRQSRTYGLGAIGTDPLPLWPSLAIRSSSFRVQLTGRDLDLRQAVAIQCILGGRVERPV